MHDFVTGLNYVRDRKTGACKIVDLEVSADSEIGTGGSSFIEMRNPAAFFGVKDAEYQYVGVVHHQII